MSEIVLETKSSVIQTYSGLAFDILHPDPEKISIIDIAHSLSMICRFTGHSRHFYSVATHSLLCSSLGSIFGNEMAFACLMHDAQEAYVSDLATPIKSLFPAYKEVENNLGDAIGKKFGILPETTKKTKVYDRMAMYLESKALLGPLNSLWDSYDMKWPEGYPTPETCYRIKSIPPQVAEQQFLERFNTLWMEK